MNDLCIQRIQVVYSHSHCYSSKFMNQQTTRMLAKTLHSELEIRKNLYSAAIPVISCLFDLLCVGHFLAFVN